MQFLVVASLLTSLTVASAGQVASIRIDAYYVCIVSRPNLDKNVDPSQVSRTQFSSLCILIHANNIKKCTFCTYVRDLKTNLIAKHPN